MLGVAPTIEHHDLLRSISVDCIMDVGANRGQFSLSCRSVKPRVPVFAFEPIPAAAQVFRRVHGAAPDVKLVETAIGDSKGTAILHVSREADSSSVLPIGKQQATLFPNTEEVATLSVSLNRLDDYAELWEERKRMLLKIDVQGFELNVLRGSTSTLQSCQYIYVECSEVELYQGQALRHEVCEFLKTFGFVETQAFNQHFHQSKLIQADYLFSRPETNVASIQP